MDCFSDRLFEARGANIAILDFHATSVCGYSIIVVVRCCILHALQCRTIWRGFGMSAGLTGLAQLGWLGLARLAGMRSWSQTTCLAQCMDPVEKVGRDYFPSIIGW